MSETTEITMGASLQCLPPGMPEWKQKAWSTVHNHFKLDPDAIPQTPYEPALHGFLLDTMLQLRDPSEKTRLAFLQLVLDMVDRGIALERLDKDGDPQKITDIGHDLVSGLRNVASVDLVRRLVIHYANAGSFGLNDLHSTGRKDSLPRNLLDTAILQCSPGAVVALLELGIDQSAVPPRSIGLSRKLPDGTTEYVVIQPGDVNGYLECMFDEGSEMLSTVRSWSMLRDIAQMKAGTTPPTTTATPPAGRRRSL